MWPRRNSYNSFSDDESVLSNSSYNSDSSSVSARSKSPIYNKNVDKTRNIESCRPVSPMTSKQWHSMHSHMHDMVDIRLGRNDHGTVCNCTNSGKMMLHIAMIFEDSASLINPLSFGQNIVRDNVSYHAEHNAIQKLKSRDTKKLMPINILVLKTSYTGLIGMSKPCAHCLAIMCTLAPKKGYRIMNVFYTNSDGNIEKHKLSSLVSSDNVHVSKLFSVRGYKHKLKEILVTP